MKKLHAIAFLLLIIGGINWGLVGLNPDWDLVAKLFGGSDAFLAKVVYILVGIAAVVELLSHKRLCKTCCKDGRCSKCEA